MRDRESTEFQVSADRLDVLEHHLGDAAGRILLAGYEYEYDIGSRPTKITKQVFSRETVDYDYDNTHQVTSADYTDAASGEA